MSVIWLKVDRWTLFNPEEMRQFYLGDDSADTACGICGARLVETAMYSLPTLAGVKVE